MLDISADEISTGKWTANDVHLKKRLGVLSDVFKRGYRRTLAQTADAVSSVINTSTGILDPASNAPIDENENGKEFVLWDQRHFTFKGLLETPALQRVQELFRTKVLSVLSDGHSVQR